MTDDTAATVIGITDHRGYPVPADSPEIRAVYRERNSLVAALSKRNPSHMARDESGNLPPRFRTIICVHMPTGQGTWHIPDDDLDLFTHLDYAPDHWDGHSADEKYARVNALADEANDRC